jgi:hypothetical protein
LTQPAATPFNNNLAPLNSVTTGGGIGGGGGTVMIRQGGGVNAKGEDGQDAEKQQFDQTFRLTENVKVYNPEDKEENVFATQIVRLDFKERQTQKTFQFKATK